MTHWVWKLWGFQSSPVYSVDVGQSRLSTRGIADVSGMSSVMSDNYQYLLWGCTSGMSSVMSDNYQYLLWGCTSNKIQYQKWTFRLAGVIYSTHVRMICKSDDEAQNYTTLDGIMGLILVDVVSDEFLQRFSRWSFVYLTRVILWSSFLPNPSDTSVSIIHARRVSRRWGDDKEASPSVLRWVSPWRCQWLAAIRLLTLFLGKNDFQAGSWQIRPPCEKQQVKSACE